jgi:hypothetical protein
MGYTAKRAQVLSIPIFIVATVMALLVAVLTDRLRHRYSFCILGLVVASVGYAMLLGQKHLSVGVKYFALFLVTPGGYITQPVTLAWVQNCMGGHYKRSVASGMMVGLGNIGGIVASNVFLDSEKPRYPTGYGTSLGLLWICGIACTVLLIGVRRENKKREAGLRDHRLTHPHADNLGDDHPSYRFAY